ncbi:MAG: tail fiber domain-containing protein, partial [Lentimicrobium sp.]|nr:tail fiber domain-containing protein [Lentimicrobium sp.]
GASALAANTTGIYNTATGADALSVNTTGDNNTANGEAALKFNTTGFANTGIGTEAMNFNTTGHENTAIGYDALYSNSTGLYNTATGGYSLNNNSTGTNNTATGISALFNNSIGNNNTANGANALYSNTNGNSNTAIGSSALKNNDTGSNNTAVGLNSLYASTTGLRNTAVGEAAAAAVSTGNYNTAIGGDAYSTGNFSNSSALGDGANITASNQVRLGDSGVTSIGGFANWTNVSDGRFKKDIQGNVPGLAFIKKLNPVTYHLDTNAIDNFMKTPEALRKKHSELAKGSKPQLETGFVAQEVEQAAKELGFDFSGVDAPKSDADYYGLRYSEFVVPLVKAVQEQQIIIENDKTKITALEIKNTQLEQRLKAIEDKLNK